MDGARSLRLNEVGDVVLGMAGAHELIMGRPHIYQQSTQGRKEISGHYVLTARNRIAFALSSYDQAQSLVIDPTLAYSTYLGGGIAQESYANAIAVDSSGYAYVAGTAGADTVPFPTTPGAYNPGPVPTATNFPFISKLKTDGSGLVYSTYFGGDYQGFSSDQIYAIAVDNSGATYFGGISGTEDNTPTTPGAFMPVRPSLNPVPFVAKLSADGSTLVYSTFLDGTPRNDTDAVAGIAVDSSGSAYVTGNTTASNFPTTAGAFQRVYQAGVYVGTGFVTKLSADGSALVYSTYLGGNYGENVVTRGAGGAIAVDASGSAYVTGNTFSTNFPTLGAINATCNSPCNEAYVSKLNPSGTSLVYSTFLGGTGNKNSVGMSIAVDSSGSAFVGGTTTFTNFPLSSNAFQSSPGPGFITKLAPDGTGPVYSSYFNGYVQSVAVGSDDSALLFGFSNTSFAFESTPDAFTIPPCTTGSCFYDFISKLTPDGSGLIFSSPIGGNQECCTAVGALDPVGNAYIAGSTASQDLYTSVGSFEPSLPSNYTGFTPFVAKIEFVTPPYATFSPGSASFDFGNVADGQSATQTITLSNTGGGSLALNGVSFGLTSHPGFSYTTSCTVPLTLSPGNSCSVTVQFAPTTPGGVSVALAFADNAGPGESTLASITGNPYYQIVTISGTGVSPAPPPEADLLINKTGPSTASPGGPIVYAISVTNSGPSIATNVVVTDPLPAGLVFASGNCSSGLQPAVNMNTNTGVNTVSCTFPSITAVSGANNVNMTVNAKLSSTATVGQTLTNMATVSEDQVNANSTSSTATTTVAATGGGSGTPACGCSKTGAYLKANAGSAPATTSSNYTASTTPSSPGGNPFTLTIKSSTGTTVLNQLFAAGTTWGFSPDGARLETDNVSGSQETVSVYNLASSTVPVRSPVFSILQNASSSRIVFSHSGQYLAYTGLTGASFATVEIYNVLTGKMVYQNGFSFQTVPGSGADTYGVVGDWGFSPDAPETSFVYAYLTGQNSAEWQLVHLEQSPLSNTTGKASSVPLTALSSAFWQFSPCADVIAIVTQPSVSFADIQFIRTIDGVAVSDDSGVPLGNITLSSTSAQQQAQDVTAAGTQTYTVKNSNFNLGCSAENTPTGSTTVQPADATSGTAPVTLTFSDVTQGGQTSMSITPTGGNAPAPSSSSFELLDPTEYFNVTTTANYSGPISICVNYSALTVPSPQNLQLLHYDETTMTWDQVSFTLSTANNMICGTVSSLSPFAVVQNIVANPTVQLITSLPSPFTLDSNGNYLATLVVQNTGNVAAIGAQLTAASLVALNKSNTVQTTNAATLLPVSLGDILPGGSASVTVSFPGTAGVAGKTAVIRFNLNSSAGNAGGSIRTTLP